MFQSILPPEPPVAPARLAEEALLALHGQDYAVRGVMELDLIYSGAAIGKKGERNSCAAIAMAVDAESGIVLAPEVADSSIPAGDTVAKVFLKAIQASRALPMEVRVRSQKLKDCLTPLMESLGVAVRVAGKLPASDEARSHLLGFFRGEFGGR
jgi:aconitase B